MWYSRLHGFLRRRVVDPVREQVEQFRRATPIASPQSAWMSAPSSPEQVLDPDVRQAMAQWTERTTPLLDRQPAQGEMLSESAVHEEVRRQVQTALQRRDQHVQALQTELRS